MNKNRVILDALVNIRKAVADNDNNIDPVMLAEVIDETIESLKLTIGNDAQEAANDETRLQNIEYRLGILEEVLDIEELYMSSTPGHTKSVIEQRRKDLLG